MATQWPSGLADDEPGRVRGGGLGMDGGDLDGGRHRVSGVRATFRRPRPISAPDRIRVRAGSGANPISVSLGFRSSAVRALEIRRRIGHLGAAAGRSGEVGEQACVSWRYRYGRGIWLPLAGTPYHRHRRRRVPPDPGHDPDLAVAPNGGTEPALLRGLRRRACRRKLGVRSRSSRSAGCARAPRR